MHSWQCQSHSYASEIDTLKIVVIVYDCDRDQTSSPDSNTGSFTMAWLSSETKTIIGSCDCATEGFNIGKRQAPYTIRSPTGCFSPVEVEVDVLFVVCLTCQIQITSFQGWA